MTPAGLGGRGTAGRGAMRVKEGVAHSSPSLVSTAPGGRRRLRRRRGRHVAAVAAGILVLAVVVAALVPVPYDAITPGTGIEVSTLVTVPSRLRQVHRGAVVLTDVELVPLRALGYLYYLLQSGDQIIPTSELTGTSTSAEYQEQGIIDMANARQAATVVALRTLGYHPRAIPDGVIVYETEPGSPAAASLPVGEVLTALDGRPVASVAALQAAIAAHRPGAAVVLTEHRFGGGAARQVHLRLGQLRVSGSGAQLAEACLPAGARSTLSAPPAGLPRSCLGITAPTIGSEQAYRVTGMPFPVSLRSDGIVGPSAGLSFTLGLLQVLSKGDLTGGRRIAATGTMSVSGQVGDVGGVAQKTAAVRAAGATVFLVPPGEVAVAKAHAGGSLQVLGVSSIGEAVADLERMGGHLGPLAARTRP